jgi:hypothetical protein
MVLEEGQRSVSPSVTSLQERLTTTISDFQELLELYAKYDWDFDTYLEEDVPAAVSLSNPSSFVSEWTPLSVLN